MAKIPQNLNNPFTGVMSQANEIKSGKYYYDGTPNLAAIHINCNTLSLNPPACVHNANCGIKLFTQVGVDLVIHVSLVIILVLSATA